MYIIEIFNLNTILISYINSYIILYFSIKQYIIIKPMSYQSNLAMIPEKLSLIFKNIKFRNNIKSIFCF